MPLLTHKSKQFLWVALKILIILGALFVIYNRLQSSGSMQSSGLWETLERKLLNGNFFILLGFTLLNWSCEISKWQTLSFKLGRLRFRESSTQTLAAHVSALVTPAKIGEFGTKALYYPKLQRKKVLFLSFLGNLYQMYATVIFGLIGLGILIFTQWKTFKLYYIIGVIGLGFSWYLAPRLLASISWNYKGFSWQRIQEFTRTLSSSRILKGKALAFLKYLIFAHQFYLVLFFLGMDIDYLQGMSLIAVMYLASSILPVMQLFDVVVRGSVAVTLFAAFGHDMALVLATTTLMWLLNVALPILPGMYFVARLQPNTISNPKEMNV